VPIERPPTIEEVIDELRARLTLVALRAQDDGEVARVRGRSENRVRTADGALQSTVASDELQQCGGTIASHGTEESRDVAARSQSQGMR
jgi:hypothetical protein